MVMRLTLPLTLSMTVAHRKLARRVFGEGRVPSHIRRLMLLHLLYLLYDGSVLFACRSAALSDGCKLLRQLACGHLASGSLAQKTEWEGQLPLALLYLSCLSMGARGLLCGAVWRRIEFVLVNACTRPAGAATTRRAPATLTRRAQHRTVTGTFITLYSAAPRPVRYSPG